MPASDNELLGALRRAPGPAPFQALLDRYGAFVLSAASRQTANEADALDATRAVFLAFARRSRKLSRKTGLALWFFHATNLACRKLSRARRGQASGVPAAHSVAVTGANDDTWARLSAVLDSSLTRLPVKFRTVLLLLLLLQWTPEAAAAALRIKPGRVESRAGKGMRLLLKRLRKRKLLISEESLRSALAVNGCAATLPPELREQIELAMPECLRRRPQMPLARSVLRGLTWARWKWRLKFVGKGMALFATVLGVVVLTGVILWHTGRLLPWLMEFGARQQVKNTPELAEPARPWLRPETDLIASANDVRQISDIYQVTNIWTAHLRFSAKGWEAMTPKRIPPVRRLIQPDGSIVLRNPKARRNGLAAAIGIEYEWTHADLEWGDRSFTNVACRFRGNGTFLNSIYGLKRPLKIELDKFDKEQRFAGVRTLNLANLVVDSSCLSDALAYELFRNAGVPAPRTAYVYLNLSVKSQMTNKPIGLYLLLEELDSQFALDRFGSKKAAIFKPVTYDLFQDLGPEWAPYAPIYDPKTKVTPNQEERLIAFARLVSHADDATFSQRVGEFLDLDEFARFLGGMVLLSSYDGFLSNGQNYYMYLDPRSNRFGFIPWDLDNAWGSFPFVGTSETREQASIWHPNADRNLFLDRVMKVEAFRTVYRAALEEMLTRWFVPEQLEDRIDTIAAVLRSPVGAESTYRLRRFEQSISTNWLERPSGGQDGPARPVHQIKRFIVNRARSVREQLDGKNQGVVFHGMNSD